MSNPLVDLHKLISPKNIKALIGTVSAIKGDKVTVLISSGTTLSVWGNNVSIGNTVLIKDSKIIARILPEKVNTRYIP